MLKRAFGKLKLEHVVIGKGHFAQERKKPETLEVSAAPAPQHSIAVQEAEIFLQVGFRPAH